MSETTLEELMATVRQVESIIAQSNDQKEIEEGERLLDNLEAKIEAKLRENSGDSYGGWGSAGMGAIDGLTLGFADEIGGGLQALFGDGTYTEYRDQLRAEFDQARQDNPGAYLAGDLATALNPYGLGTLAIKGAAKAVGAGNRLANANALVKAGTYGAGESAIASYGANRENNADGMLTNSALGALTGAGLQAGLGVGGRFAGTAMEALDGLVSSQASKGQRAVTKALNNDGINTPQQLRDVGGNQAMVADAGPNTQALLRQTAMRQGEAQRRAVDALEQRNRTAPQRVANAVNDATADVGGSGTTARTKLSRIEEAAKAKATPLYQAAYSKPVMETPELDDLMSVPAVKQAMKQAEIDMANSRDPVMGRDPQGAGLTPRLLHYTMKALGNKGEVLSKGSRERGAAYFQLRDELRQALVSQNKEFAAAQKLWSDKSAFGRAVKDGENALGRNDRLANQVEDYRAMTETERAAFRIGVGDDLARRVEQLADSVEGTPLGVGNRIIKNDAQKGIIKEIFGAKGGKLTEVINNEARFRSTSNKMKNSVTARDTADAKEGLAPAAAEAATNPIFSIVKGFFSYLTGGLDEAGRSAAVDGLLKQIDKMSDDELMELVTSGKLERMVSNVYDSIITKTQLKSGEAAARMTDSLVVGN